MEELLDITGVDAEDNFFALGGDSIISIKWSAQANAQGLAMTPPMVFEHMTIAELAAAVDAASRRPACSPTGFGAGAAIHADERIGPERRCAGRADRVLAETVMRPRS